MAGHVCATLMRPGGEFSDLECLFVSKESRRLRGDLKRRREGGWAPELERQASTADDNGAAALSTTVASGGSGGCIATRAQRGGGWAPSARRCSTRRSSRCG
uniref:Uncharacterized protein n=1 Tax=Oryza sativa subsp. japonica TaxID=39947 RepID=Q851H4_ORYSJ|nr:hypothetical protein [Oryza sativa Japonica Group]